MSYYAKERTMDGYPPKEKKKRSTKKLCEGCGKKIAVYFKKGKKRNARRRVRTGKHHPLCITCFRREIDRTHAARLAQQEKAEERKKKAAEATQSKVKTKEARGEEKRRQKRQRKRWEKKQDIARDAGRRARDDATKAGEAGDDNAG